LTANREAAAVADATITIDRLEALEVASDFTAEIAFNHPLVLGDNLKDLVKLLFGKIRSAHVGIEAGFKHNLVGTLWADSVDVTEGDRDFLFRGNFNTE
jgi:hypothetical protein